MLFDLRSRGRRNTVRAVYIGLALLMVVGLIGVGVGTGNGNGGIFNAFTGNGSGSGSAQKQVVSQQEKQALAATRANPNSAQAWGQLLQARFTAAGQGSNFNTATNSYTAGGKKELAAATDAWQRYVSLTKTPDPTLAILAARSYMTLGNFGAAANAWEAETLAEPSAVKGYECLAFNSYAAGQARKGDLASAKAISLAPKAQQSTTKQGLNAAKASKSTAQQLAQQC
jgi:predicted Zn-dependent protease